MIDHSTERIISLTEAAKRCPKRRGGKRPHVSCIYRWTTTGCRGVILESIQIGGTRCTSEEALGRFFQRLSLPGESAPAIRTLARQRVASEGAAKKLERIGV
jgi:hypothetical protein